MDAKDANLPVDRPEKTCPLGNYPGSFSFSGRDLLYNKTQKYNYLQCGRCDAVYQAPTPSAEQISSFYPEDYKPHEQLGVPRSASQLKRAVLKYNYGYVHLNVPNVFRLMAPFFSVFKYRDTIPFVPNGKGLDIGCGNGKFMRTMNSFGWDFEGVELSPLAVKACRSSGLRVSQGDLHAAGFENESFDLITARHVIEHIPIPADFVQEICRLLKKGGCLVIETPNSKALGRKWFGPNWYANDVPRHLVLYCLTNLHKLAADHGLRLVEAKMFTSPKIILNSWDYKTGNRDRPSRRRKIYRLLAKFYVALAILHNRGDVLFAIFKKP
jgi:2-polyprenyl-3-methyl-5-hydroxy-6-metoxy-1,4-benzoquinol methylase